jgi:SAM-dependent methyltransferase
MGRSDPWLRSFYGHNIQPKGEVALLGFTKNDYFEGDLYDRQLLNWDINSDWLLPKKYDTIISLRCPYFAKDPESFIRRCHEHLNPGGTLYADWGLGDHWRKFKDYKIGWVKDGEREYSYGEDNFLWSAVWDDSFEEDSSYVTFSERVKAFGYLNVKEAIHSEVPSVLNFEYINKYFEIGYNMIALWEDRPQLYILIKATKKV